MSLTDTELNSAEIPADELEDEEPEHIDVANEPLDPEGDEEEPEADDDDLLIAFGDEEIEPEPDNKTIRQMREKMAEKDRRIRELEAKVPKVEVGPMPKITDEGIDFDEDKHQAAMDAWIERRDAAKAQMPVDDPAAEMRADLDRSLGEYQAQKARLNRPDMEVKEALVTSKLTMGQQAALVTVAKNKAALVYALGSYPERLDALAGLKNDYKFATAVADIERSLKVQPRKQAPAPQGRPRGGTPVNQDMKDRARNQILDKASDGGDVTEQLRKLRAMRSK